MEKNNDKTLHITSGDSAGNLLEQTGIPGEVFVWHDILYDGPRNPGWPTQSTLQDRSRFIEAETANGLSREYVLKTFIDQYQKLEDHPPSIPIVLWFDACLFDQSMLVHILTCLDHLNLSFVELICVDEFPGIDPYNGLGQMTPAQLASVYDRKRTVTPEEFEFARTVDAAFADQDLELFKTLSRMNDAAIPWIPKAVKRWLEELPDKNTGFGKLETLILKALDQGIQKPIEIFKFVAQTDTLPQYWGDTMLWAKINGLADRNPPLVTISGSVNRLPQYIHDLDLTQVTIERNSDGLR